MRPKDEHDEGRRAGNAKVSPGSGQMGGGRWVVGGRRLAGTCVLSQKIRGGLFRSPLLFSGRITI